MTSGPNTGTATIWNNSLSTSTSAVVAAWLSIASFRGAKKRVTGRFGPYRERPRAAFLLRPSSRRVALRCVDDNSGLRKPAFPNRSSRIEVSREDPLQRKVAGEQRRVGLQADARSRRRLSKTGR